MEIPKKSRSLKNRDREKIEIAKKYRALRNHDR